MSASSDEPNPFNTGALEQKLGIKPLFRISYFNVPYGKRIAFRSDQDKEEWYDQKIHEGFDAKWSESNKEMLVVKSNHDARLEFMRDSLVEPTEVEKKWKDTKSAWKHYEYPEYRLLDKLDGELGVFTTLEVRPWSFMVFGLPTTHMKAFQTVAYRQYFLAIDLMNRLTKHMEEGTKEGASPHIVMFDATHMELAKTPDEPKDPKLLTKEIEEIGAWATPQSGKPPFRFIGQSLQKMLEICAAAKLNRQMLIMFKPMNPIRQLLSHVFKEKDVEDLPPLIICTDAKVDNKLPPAEGKHTPFFLKWNLKYSGDRNSDEVVRFFDNNYCKRELTTDDAFNELPFDGRQQAKQEIKHLFGELTLYIRKDLSDKMFGKPALSFESESLAETPNMASAS